MVIDIVPNHEYALFQKGLVIEMIKDYENIVNEISIEIEANPDNIKLYRERAYILKIIGNNNNQLRKDLAVLKNHNWTMTK